MATLQQLEQALVRADAAGDVDAARQLAAAIKAARAEPQENPGFLNQVGRQVGLTGRYAMEGVANAVGVVTNPITAMLEQATGRDLQTVPELASRGADAMGLPKPRGAMENVVGAAARGVAGAVPFMGAGAAMSGAASPVTQAVGRGMAAQPTAQLASGAGGSGAAEVVNQEGGGQAAQLAASLVGGVAGSALANRATTLAQAPRSVQPQIVQDARQANIPLMTTDVVPPRTFMGKFAQGVGEKVPVAGTAGLRSSQQAARVEAVKKLAIDVGGDFENIPDAALAQSLKAGRAADVSKYADLKQGVFDKLDNAGAMPATNVTKKVDDEIQRLQALGTKDFDPLISKLDDFKGAIQGKTINQVELLRKQLGEKLQSEEFTAIAGESQKVLRSTYGALKSDIESFIKTSASDRDVVKWKVADKRLTSMIGELQSTAFKRALDKGDITPESATRLLLNGSKSDLQRMFRTLTPDGRAVARATIIRDAAAKAGGMDDISPQKFSTALSKSADQYGIFFSQDQRKQADGLIRVINATQRASEAAAAPMTGYQTIPLALVDLFGSGGKTIVAGLTMGGIARAYESKPVRELLIRMAAVKPNSPEEGAIVRRIVPMLQEMTQPKEENND
jgi:hypothetical protein